VFACERVKRTHYGVQGHGHHDQVEKTKDGVIRRFSFAFQQNIGIFEEEEIEMSPIMSEAPR